MILSPKTHSWLFDTYANRQYIKGKSDIRLLKESEFDAYYVSGQNEKKEHLTYVLPYLFFHALENLETQSYAIELLAKLNEKRMTALIEAIFAHGLMGEIKAQYMKEFLPYVNLNKHFEFDLYAPAHYHAGLTAFMIAKEHGTVDLLLAQPELDLSLKAKPLTYIHEFEQYLASKPSLYEKVRDSKEMYKIEGKDALAYSLYYKEKYKRNKLLALIPEDVRANNEKEKFEAIVSESKVHQKTSKFIKEVFLNNQYLISHLDDVRLRDALIYNNERQSNALFHALKEGKRDVAYKLLELDYFKKHDKSNTSESYFSYAYRHGQKTIALTLFDEGYYFENLDTIKKKAIWNRDSVLYEKVITRQGQKEDLYSPIRAGAISSLNYLFEHFTYSDEEKEKTIKHYAYLLLDKTHPEMTYQTINLNNNIQKAYFNLLKLCSNTVENEEKYFDIFAASYREAFELTQHKLNNEFLEKESVVTFSHLVRINPNLKKQALNLFLGLSPNNPDLINIEKKGFDNFLNKMEKAEKKQEKTQQTQERKRIKI
jgi:hypothetical protein